MNKIPTAIELFETMTSNDYEVTTTEMMVAFAKLHVEAALKAAGDLGKQTWDWTTEECNSIIEDAYPLDNIKPNYK